MSTAQIILMPTLSPVGDLCPCCGGDCCEECGGIGSGEAYMRTQLEAIEAIEEETRIQLALEALWAASELAKKIPGDLGDWIRRDIAEAIKLIGGE